MRSLLAVALVACLLGAGCVQVAERQIDRSRERATPSQAAPEESTAEPDAPAETNETPANLTPTPTTTPTSPPPATSTPAPSTPVPVIVVPTPSPVVVSPTPPPSTPTATPPAGTPAPVTWPHEGSFARYNVDVGRSFTGSSQSWRAIANASWTYHDGDWHGTCDATIWDNLDGKGVKESHTHRTYSAEHPPHWPLLDTRTPPAVGEQVNAWLLDVCDITSESHTFVGGDATTYRAADDRAPYAFSTTWSRATGLVTGWSATRSGLAPTHNVGTLVATDAP